MRTLPPQHSQRVTVIGAGIAGSEAAWQLGCRGVPVTLVEMRPVRSGPAHHTPLFAELVCSNSLKSDDPSTAAGQLKRELEMMGSLVMRCARATQVPAGGALAVDRDRFAACVTRAVTDHPLIEIVHAEADRIPSGHVIIATGPLTSSTLEPALDSLLGGGRLAFYDAAAPIVDTQTLDHDLIFTQSRYDKGGTADYLNCPLDREEYEAFIDALLDAKRVTEKEFENRELFSACQPVEEIARKGRDALRYGPMKPVGLTDPRTGLRPWAVVQLRAENAAGTSYNLVGFQTNLTFSEQRRVFGMIPGLRDAEFTRFGVMHRNTFVDAPRLLDATLAVREHPRIRIAGQLAGTEGYLEAAAGGLLAGTNTAAHISGLEPFILPSTTSFGALIEYATDPATDPYQPMHVNWGIVPPMPSRIKRKRERYEAYAARAQEAATSAVGSHPSFREVQPCE